MTALQQNDILFVTGPSMANWLHLVLTTAFPFSALPYSSYLVITHSI